MKVTKHGFTYMDTDDTQVHLCPECQYTMRRSQTNSYTRMIFNSIKWDKHYEKYRCNCCGCEGEEYIGCDNLRIRSGLIPLIITIIVSLIVHPLLWYWACWCEETYQLTEADAATLGLAFLVVLALGVTIFFIVKSISDLTDDVTFILR